MKKLNVNDVGAYFAMAMIVLLVVVPTGYVLWFGGVWIVLVFVGVGVFVSFPYWFTWLWNRYVATTDDKEKG